MTGGGSGSIFPAYFCLPNHDFPGARLHCVARRQIKLQPSAINHPPRPTSSENVFPMFAAAPFILCGAFSKGVRGMKRFLSLVVILIVSLPAMAQQSTTPAPKTIYIRAGRLFDATGDNVRENVVIVVLGDRIQSVGAAASVSIPAGASVIDLSHATVLPGLIDCHTHLGARADRYDEIYRFKDTPFQSAFAAVVNARKTLEAGFTSVRDVGSEPFLAVDLRNSINEGFIPVPPLLASVPA